MDTFHCQENNAPPVQQTTLPTEHQHPCIESMAKEWGSRTPCTCPLKPKATSTEGGDAHGALHLLVLAVVVGQTGGIVGRSAEVLRATSVVCVELAAGEEGSMPGQSNVMLALSAERCRMLLQLGTDRD